MSQDPTKDLPQVFKSIIREVDGQEVTLVIEKSLYQTDLNTWHNRLSMPTKQIKKMDFLREGELQALKQKQAIEVLLIEPSLDVTKIILAKWDMPKANKGTVSTSYVLRTSWNKVVADNHLKKNDVVQVWSFRAREQLCMALVKV